MKKPIDSSYSKFRYDNNFTPKFRVENNTFKMYGIDVRPFKDQIKTQLSDMSSTWINIGATWVVSHIYRCTQITRVDEPVVYDKNASRSVFFKLFKL
jgi:hypothetical protein